ncbi:WbqC family protein [Alphaproteobacteria bacterium]|nr:WbqC family protein [Alphaproteobacteria bacterium]
MDKIVSIHQPNYLPWIGYFHKILYSDILVFLDTVQYTPKTYTNRCFILQNGSPVRLSIPVNLDKWEIPIKEVKINTDIFAKKHLKTLEFSYKKAKYYDQIMSIIYPHYQLGKTNLADFNMNIIKDFILFLKIEINFINLSELNLHTKKNQLLIDITKSCKGNIFVSGTGAKGYIKGHEHLYKNESIDLAFQNFNHPSYSQLSKPFIEGMSIIDLLFNHGPQTLKILQDIKKPDFIFA